MAHQTAAPCGAAVFHFSTDCLYTAGMSGYSVLEEVDAASRRFTAKRAGVLVLIVLAHLLALYGLARALAPEFVATLERDGLEAITLVELPPTPEPPPPPPPKPQPRPDEGAQGAPGRQAVAQPREAPEVRLPLRPPEPIPTVASTGTATRQGAADAGEGTGAGGVGSGTGSGFGGEGQGGRFTPTKPVKIAGDINSSADYPTPPGGREIRRGRSVTIFLTVNSEGRATGCRIGSPSPDPVADRITCELATERFRFEPARDARGEAVSGVYGWRQRWF